MKTSSLLCLVAAAALACSSFAQNNPPPRDASNRYDGEQRELSRSDRRFLEKAAKSGLKEVAVSQAVANRLSNVALKDFAQMMVADHTKANLELMAIAQRKGVQLPTTDQKLVSKWRDREKDLDDNYVKEMVSDHKDAIDLFEDAAKSVDNDIAAFARKTLPSLRHHLQVAEGLKKRN